MTTGLLAVVRVAVLLVVAMVWLLVNLKAGQTWIKRVSLFAMFGCLGAATWLGLYFAWSGGPA